MKQNLVTVRRGVEDMDQPKHQKSRPQPTAAATTRQALWQREFFDHLLRTTESYSEKWNYVRDNPVRSGFVVSADDWPYAGEIERLEF
jgi:hypothetical protein